MTKMIRMAPLAFLATAALAVAVSDGTWTNKAPLPVGRAEVGVAALGDNIYVIGGTEQDAQGHTNYASTLNTVYDARRNSWEQRAPLPLGLSHVGVAALAGKIYAVGGFTNIVHMNPQAVAFVYDPKTNRWSQLPVLSNPRGSVAVAAVGGRLHLFGGRLSNKVTRVPLPPGAPELFAGYGTVTTHQVFDPATGRWAEGSPIPGPARDHLGIAVLGSKVHLFGGRIADFGDNLDRHDVYDTANDTWSTAAPLPVARSAGAATVLDGHIIYAGGECKPSAQPPSTDAYDDVTSYDPKTNLWSKLTPLPTARHAFGAATVNNVAYFMGGAPVCGGGATTDTYALTLR